MNNNHKESQQLVSHNETIEISHLHSEDVNEILGSVPHWTVRSGSGYLFILVILGLLISWFVRYPDIVKAPIVLTTNIPPVNIVSQSSGYLTLWVKDKQNVREGQYLGFLKNSSDVSTVLSVIKNLDTFKARYLNNPTALHTYKVHDAINLGDLQSPYNLFVQSLRNYQFFVDQKENSKRKNMVESEIKNYNALQQQQKTQSSIMEKELQISRQLFERDSILYTEKVISKSEFEEKKREYLTNVRAYKNNVSNISNIDIQKVQLASRITDLTLNDQRDLNDLLQKIQVSLNELDVAIKKWEQAYMIKSPLGGNVALFTYWSDNQFVKPSEEILTVIPEKTSYYVHAQLPVSGSGKVRTGQRVNIQLDNFPYREFGTVPGVISDISMVPKEKSYLITVRLPRGLETSYKKKIEFKQEMTGTAEIITQDLRLLQRIFYQVRELLANK